jgi:F-type H+-transporting ATPase subunit a
MKFASPLESHVLFAIGPVPISQPVATTWGIMAFLTIGSWLLTRRLALRPTRAQAALELVVETVAGQIRETMEAEPQRYLPLIGTLFLFLLVANWSSLIPGVEPPTATLETDAALALIVFGATLWFGVRALGPRAYLATFARPSILLAPLNIVELFTRSFSLMVRLFGNVMSGVFMIGVVLSLAGLLVPIPLMALEMLTGAVQAYIFGALAMVFIGSAISENGARPPSKQESPHELDPSRQHPRSRFRDLDRRNRPGARAGQGRRRRDGRDRAPARSRQHRLAHAVRGPRDDRDDGDLLPRDRAAAALRQPVRLTCGSTGGRSRCRRSMSSSSCGCSDASCSVR